jgi:hypothetical protein
LRINTNDKIYTNHQKANSSATKNFDPPQVIFGSQLVNQPASSITPASNMIDLTLNKTSITSDDNWQVVQVR